MMMMVKFMFDLLQKWTNWRSGPNLNLGPDRYELAFQARAVDVRAFVSIHGPSMAPAIIIEIPKTAAPDSFSALNTRAFQAKLAEILGLSVGKTCFAIHLTDLALIDLFALLGNEIMEAVEKSTSAEGAVKSVIHCIERWRRFTNRNSGALDKLEVRGLIGELAILGRCAQSLSPREALAAWMAPDSGLRDFEFAGHTIEVKTFQASGSAALRISDTAQLDDSPSRPLYLAAIQLSEATSGHTLPEIVVSVENLMGNDNSTIENFYNALASYGYLREQAETYTNRYTVGPLSLFKVTEGFPRITSLEVPAGVTDVKYSLPLGGIAKFKVPAEPVVGRTIPTIEVEPNVRGS